MRRSHRVLSRFVASIPLVLSATASFGQTPSDSVSGVQGQRPWIDLATPPKELSAALARAKVTASYVAPDDHLFAYIKGSQSGANCNEGGALIQCVVQGPAEIQLGNITVIRRFRRP